MDTPLSSMISVGSDVGDRVGVSVMVRVGIKVSVGVELGSIVFVKTKEGSKDGTVELELEATPPIEDGITTGVRGRANQPIQNRIKTIPVMPPMRRKGFTLGRIECHEIMDLLKDPF